MKRQRVHLAIEDALAPSLGRFRTAVVAGSSSQAAALVRRLSAHGVEIHECLAAGGDYGAGGTTAEQPDVEQGSLFYYLMYNPQRLIDADLLIVEAGVRAQHWPRLFRGRLRPEQGFGVLRRGDGELSWLAEWPPPMYESGGLLLFEAPPPRWQREWTPTQHERLPRISIITVSFNQAAFLEECLKSVLGQNYPELEYIVVDGGSSDGSIEILERYRERLSVLIIEPDEGQADGLNKGFARASGDIIAWVNSDDMLEPGALHAVANAWLTYDVDMVVGGCRHVWYTRDRVLANHYPRLPLGLPLPLPLDKLLDFDKRWQRGEFFYQPEVFFSRRSWLAAGGMLRTDLHYVIDYELWLRLAQAGATVVQIPDFLAVSRGHEGQKTNVEQPYMPEVRRLLEAYRTHGIALDTAI